MLRAYPCLILGISRDMSIFDNLGLSFCSESLLQEHIAERGLTCGWSGVCVLGYFVFFQESNPQTVESGTGPHQVVGVASGALLKGTTHNARCPFGGFFEATPRRVPSKYTGPSLVCASLVFDLSTDPAGKRLEHQTETSNAKRPPMLGSQFEA